MMSVKSPGSGGNAVKINEGYAGLLFLSEGEPPRNVIRAEERYEHDSSYSPEIIWEYNSGEYQTARCLAVDSEGYSYIGGNDSKLTKISSDGTMVWEYTNDTYISNSVLVDADGYVYFCDLYGGITKINPNGGKVWKSSVAGDGISIDNCGYLYASSGNTVYKVKCSDGKQVWKRELASSARGASIYPKSASPDGKYVYAELYTDYYDHIVYKIDASKGSVILSITGSGFGYTDVFSANCIVAAEDYVYIGGYGCIHKITPEGIAVWNFSIPGNSSGSVYTLDVDPAGCILFHNTGTGAITKLSPNAGVLWRFSDDTKIGDGSNIRIAVLPDGKYIFSNGKYGGILKIKNTIKSEKIAYYE